MYFNRIITIHSMYSPNTYRSTFLTCLCLYSYVKMFRFIHQLFTPRLYEKIILKVFKLPAKFVSNICLLATDTSTIIISNYPFASFCIGMYLFMWNHLFVEPLF